MEFTGTPGFYEFELNMAQCSGSYIGWEDYVYDYESGRY